MSTGRSSTARSGTPAIDAEGLVRRFGDNFAVAGVDLKISPGEIYGVLGPNGAGKTTTIRILATLLRPDSGTARVFGHDVVSEGDAVRRRVSLTGQFASVDEDLTGFENLVLIARLLGHSRNEAKRRADELLEAFGLADAADRQVKTYSGGMRRKLDIAASIVVTPDLIFLDEPTTGLDPRSRNQVWDIIRALASEGTTVLLTTQYLDEADQLADRIVVIDNGKVIAEGTPGELKSSVGSGVLRVRLREPEARYEAERLLSQMLGVTVETPSDPVALMARVSEPEQVSHAISEDALRSALSSSKRPRGPNALSASLTFRWRAMLKIKHVPEQLFDAVGNPIIFTLLFTYLLGGAIGGSPGAYLQFLLPGILVQTVLLITSYTGFNLNTDISKGVADRFRSLPVWRPS